MKILHPRELSEENLTFWRYFQSQNPSLASPYLTPEFALVTSGVRPNTRVAVFNEGSRTLGFFPFERCGRIAKPVARELSDCQAVIADPTWNWDPMELISALGLSVYDFTYHRVQQVPLQPFHRGVHTSHVIDLSRGFDSYVEECRNHTGYAAKGLSGSPHHTMARKRRLEREVGQLRFKLNDPDPEPLRQLIAWKNLQYKRNGLNVFALWKVELLKRIHATQTINFAGMLSTLRVGDKLIAAHMGMRSASVLHYWFPAFDMAYAKFSPGLIILLEMCRAIEGTGIRTVELGAGNEPYKLLMANANIPVAAGFVGVPSFALRRRELVCESLQRVGRLPIGPFAQWPEKLIRRLLGAETCRSLASWPTD